MSQRGKYIVIEGAEGVGKTTMVQILGQQLQAAGLPVKIMREPESQNDLTARAIRRLTQDPRYPMSTRTEVLLYNAARSQSLEIIRDATDNGVYCLVDRSYLTTLAIQYYGRGDVHEYAHINEIINFAVGDMEPDLMVVLDAPVNILRARVQHRYAGERFDNLDEAFLERVRAGYLWEAKQRELPVVYATGDVNTVFKEVWQHVATTLAIRDKDGRKSEPQSVAEVLAATPPAKTANVEPPIIISKEVTAESSAPVDGKEAPATTQLQPLAKLDSIASQSTPGYFVPRNLSKKLTAVYKQKLDDILKSRAQLLKELQTAKIGLGEAASLTLPTTSYLNGEREAIKNLKALSTGKLANFTRAELHETHSSDEAGLKLVSFWPRNELSIIPDILYPYSNLPLEQLANQADSWTYGKKEAFLTKHLSGNANALLTDANYVYELTISYYLLLALCQAGARIEHQQLTPRYGYDVPAAIEEAGLAERFESCFDASLELFSQLQAGGHDAEAQLVTLLGHKAHCKVTLSGNQLATLQAASITEPDLKALVHELTAAVADVHPLIADALTKPGK